MSLSCGKEELGRKGGDRFEEELSLAYVIIYCGYIIIYMGASIFQIHRYKLDILHIEGGLS